MPKYLFIASYTAEGMQGVLAQGGTSRRTVVEKTAADLGGRLLAFDFAFGGEDAYVTAELPDHQAAAALAMRASASGAVRVKTVVLLTPEEIDSAAHQSVSYSPPGKA